jgi:phosphatidylglycerophosphatase A
VTEKTVLSLKERWASCIAALGIIGSCPVAPGTAAAAVTGVGFFFLVRVFGAGIWFPAFTLTLVLGQWACVHLPKHWGEDPKQAVIDESAGQLVALAFLPPSVRFYAAGFLLFRLFDVWKPGPVRWVEARGGPWSVMGDDLVAGAAARGLLVVLQVV